MDFLKNKSKEKEKVGKEKELISDLVKVRPSKSLEKGSFKRKLKFPLSIEFKCTESPMKKVIFVFRMG